MHLDAKQLFALLAAACLMGCSFNPFVSNNHTTGSATGTVVGAAAGAGSVALFSSSKSLMVAAGLGGGMLGYYLTTLRHDAGGIVQEGGQVYQVGDIVGIYIQTDQVFESNTADFLPQARPILESASAVLKRFPNHNIIISGNTSGFGAPRWEQRLSEQRAQKIAAFLWNDGVNQFKEPGISMRKLTYVGYGDYFPIASDLRNKGIRKNSRIQIVSYPSICDLKLDKRHAAMRNMGGLDDFNAVTVNRCGNPNY